MTTPAPAKTLFGQPINDLAFLRRLLVYVADHGGGTRSFPECELTSCASCQAVHLLDTLPDDGALLAVPAWALDQPDREWRLIPTGSLDAVMALDPGDHATTSRDYGRGFAEAVRIVHGLLTAGQPASSPPSRPTNNRRLT